MLEQVALGQARFITPGVAPDQRGVLLGRHGLLLFPTLEGVVSWLRLYSAESSLDEILPGLAIMRVRTPLRTQEMILQIPATSSYALDRAARCARLVGGATFTGTSKHFVKYRDERSPYGYDVADIQALPQGADLMLYADDFTQVYAREADLPFDQLLFRLSLRRVAGGDRLADDERRELVVTAARGLADGIIRYLWRNRVGAEVGLATPKRRTAFADPGAEHAFLIMRLRDLPARILDLFLAAPGIDVFRPIAANVAVEVGYRHLIDLSSCASLFPADSFHLFWGGEDRVDVVPGPLELSRIENLTRIDVSLDQPPALRELAPGKAEVVGVDIRLAPSLAPPRHVIGTLIPLAQAAWLKKLVYVLPQALLRGHRVAVTERGIVLIADEDIDVVPLGQLLAELAPGLLVPLGMDLVPRVAPDVLARTLSHGAGLLTIFPGDGKPFQVNEAALQPLERRSLAKVEVGSVQPVDTRLEPPGDPSVVNEDVGRFALWGFPGPKRGGQLPPAKGGA